jgi:hypothetical protein
LGLLAAQGRSDPRIRSAVVAFAVVGLLSGVVEDGKVSGSIAALGPTVHVGIGVYLLVTGSILALVAAWRGRLGKPGAATAE